MRKKEREMVRVMVREGEMKRERGMLSEGEIER